MKKSNLYKLLCNDDRVTINQVCVPCDFDIVTTGVAFLNSRSVIRTCGCKNGTKIPIQAYKFFEFLDCPDYMKTSYYIEKNGPCDNAGCNRFEQVIVWLKAAHPELPLGLAVKLRESYTNMFEQMINFMAGFSKKEIPPYMYNIPINILASITEKYTLAQKFSPSYNYAYGKPCVRDNLEYILAICKSKPKNEVIKFILCRMPFTVLSGKVLLELSEKYGLDTSMEACVKHDIQHQTLGVDCELIVHEDSTSVAILNRLQYGKITHTITFIDNDLVALHEYALLTYSVIGIKWESNVPYRDGKIVGATISN
jgi:hypothetical protein